MKVKEFFDAVRDALGQTESGNDPIGCDYFISDMEKLFEEWEEESKHLERKM